MALCNRGPSARGRLGAPDQGARGESELGFAVGQKPGPRSIPTGATVAKLCAFYGNYLDFTLPTFRSTGGVRVYYWGA